MHWDIGMAGTRGQLGCGDSHTQRSLGGCDTGTVTPGDMGTARTQGCRDNMDRGTALREGTGTVIIRNTVHGDSWDTGTSPLPLSPGLTVAFGLSPLPPPPRRPRGTMNMLAPVRRDRVIADLPPVSWGGTTVTQGWPRWAPCSPRCPPLSPRPVFSEGGRPARPPRLPPRGGQRLPGAADGHRGVSLGRFGGPHPRAG